MHYICLLVTACKPFHDYKFLIHHTTYNTQICMMMHDALNTYLLKRNDIKYTLLQERLSNTQQTSPAGMFSSTVSLRKAQHTMLTQWYVCVQVPIIHKLTIKVFIHKRYKIQE